MFKKGDKVRLKTELPKDAHMYAIDKYILALGGRTATITDVEDGYNDDGDYQDIHIKFDNDDFPHIHNINEMDFVYDAKLFELIEEKKNEKS